MIRHCQDISLIIFQVQYNFTTRCKSQSRHLKFFVLRFSSNTRSTMKMFQRCIMYRSFVQAAIELCTNGERSPLLARHSSPSLTINPFRIGETPLSCARGEYHPPWGPEENPRSLAFTGYQPARCHFEAASNANGNRQRIKSAFEITRIAN